MPVAWTARLVNALADNDRRAINEALDALHAADWRVSPGNRWWKGGME